MKKTNLKLTVSFLLSFLLVLFILPIKAQWVIFRSNDEDTRTATSSNSKQNVCYIAGDTDANGYTTVEAGLAAATKKGGSQKVVVTANTTITHDCVISAGVELRIPYNDTIIEFQDPTTAEVKNCGADAPKTLKYTVTVSANINIKIYGALTVRGEFGGISNQFTSHSFNNYSQRMRKKGANLEVFNGGSVRCFGFIKEDFSGTTDYLSGNGSAITVHAGGSVWEPLTIYDWPGGKEIATNYWPNKVFPFKKFDRPNIYSSIIVEAGGSLFGQIQIKFSGGDINKKVPVIALANSLILLTSGRISWDYGINSSSQAREKNRNNHLTKLTVEGNASLGSMSVSVKVVFDITIDSSEYFIPMGPQFSAHVKSGSFVMGNKSYWFGGNNLIVDAGAMASFTADTALFDDVSLINNGILSISGAFGGKIITEGAGATLAIGDKTSISAKFDSTDNKKSFDAKGYQSSTDSDRKALTKKLIYESSLRTGQQKEGYWKNDPNLYLIRYSLNNYVTVSDNVKAQIGNQRSTKYRDGSASITIVDPRDDELQRSYQETVVTGEGEDATVEVKTYSNYATYTGWNTEEYGQGMAITPGSTRTISELANQCDSHLRMLYDVWTSAKKVTIHFLDPDKIDSSDKIEGNMPDVSISFLSRYTMPEPGRKLKKQILLGYLPYVFDYWERISSSAHYSQGSKIVIDESVVSLSSPTINLKPVFKNTVLDV